MQKELIRKYLQQAEELERQFRLYASELEKFAPWLKQLSGELHTLTIVLQAMEREEGGQR